MVHKFVDFSKMTDLLQSFKNVPQNFLGNAKSKDYENIVNELLENDKNVGCSMNRKLHFLHSHLDYFPQNLGDYS